MRKKVKYTFYIILILMMSMLIKKHLDAPFDDFIKEGYPEQEMFKNARCSCDKTKINTVLEANSLEADCGCQIEKFKTLISYKFPIGTDIKVATKRLHDVGMNIKGVSSCAVSNLNCSFMVLFVYQRWWTEYTVIFEVNENNKLIKSSTNVWYVGL